MADTQQYDAIVIGSGQGGKPLARALAAAGRKTAIVEREHVGGTCVNEGCTPTKTMVASARVAYLARRAGDYGVRTGPVSVDVAKVRQRKRAIVDRFREGEERQLKKTEGSPGRGQLRGCQDRRGSAQERGASRAHRRSHLHQCRRPSRAACDPGAGS